ncbi:hypothetical protein Poly41_19980 [Novipirellula artificiosorum]|uniref:Uncharacterized protein n=1 Tax=Novipirellula artificiosorum TaxID=2528016 RepID=A0A5C6DVU9_9BACT|nr:hypothetical protein Poly41_19980 [Novipirellula artificiosorum]
MSAPHGTGSAASRQGPFFPVFHMKFPSQTHRFQNAAYATVVLCFPDSFPLFADSFRWIPLRGAPFREVPIRPLPILTRIVSLFRSESRRGPRIPAIRCEDGIALLPPWLPFTLSPLFCRLLPT